MSKGIKDNYLTIQNGCRVIEASSERMGSSANNILNGNERDLWVVEKKLPQFCIIDTSGMCNYPKTFNRIGFYCWHEYQSNPALIQVAYNNGNNEEWVVVGKIRLELKSEQQYFKIKEIPVTEMAQLKITLLENYGDKSTYLNKIQLGYLKEPAPLEASRQRTVSEFIKLTSTEKELKKAQEEIKRLSKENEQVKHTVKRQGQIMIEMQNSLKLVTKQLEKLHKIQAIFQKKMNIHIKEKEIDRAVENKFKREVNFGTHSSQSQHSDDDRKYVLDKLNTKKEIETIHSRTNNQSYAKSQRNSHKKYREESYEDSKFSKNATIRHSKHEHVGKNKSDSELSEYLVSQKDEQKSKYSQKCSEMMVKLQILLAEREKRNRQLRQKAR